MFKKPVRVKSNNQVKASERKSIREQLLKSCPNLTEAESNELFNKKETLNVLKVVTHNEEVIQVYTIQKRPMFFDIRGKIFPTVFLLWKYPNLLQALTTHSQVMNFISSGADLMLPGVVTPPLQSGFPKYGTLQEGDVTYVNLTTNKAAVAVGVAAQSSTSMIQSNGRGKGVIIYHFYGDTLCTLEGMSNLPIASLGVPQWLSFKTYEEDFPKLGAERTTNMGVKVENVSQDAYGKSFSTENKELNQEALGNEDTKNEYGHSVEKDEPQDPLDEMDELIWYCFLGAIKYSKTLALPLLISNFFKLQMLPVCPPDKTLDIKKSSYKKLKPFLDIACAQGIITVKEIKKGVEAITAVNKDNPKISEFYIRPSERPKKESSEVEDKQTNVTESYIITQNVVPIFQGSCFEKGATVQGADIRKYVTKFVKDHNCQDESNSQLVTPKDALKTICKTENSITWDEVIEKVCAAMKNCYKVTSGEDQFVNKGKISPITMTVSVRSGNKKVTLVDNLELFGININEFAKECQHGVAASTSITQKPAGKKSDQLLVQGNQIVFVYNLLVEKYKIPKKYVKGLENAPKKKK